MPLATYRTHYETVVADLIKKGTALWNEFDVADIPLHVDWDRLPNLHCATKAMIRSAVPIAQDDISQIHVYIDGSGTSRDHEVASWGIAVVGYNVRDEHTMIGYTGAVVQLDASMIDFVGAQQHANNVGELCAQTWAHLWIYLNAHRYKGRLTICYDSAYSACMTALHSNPRHHQHQHLISVNRLLHMIVSSRVMLELHHVYAHDGHPWNGCVDCVCAYAKDRSILRLRRWPGILDKERVPVTIILSSIH